MCSNLLTCHFGKSVQIRSFFWFVSSRIQSEYRKIRTKKKKTTYLDTFHAVCGLVDIWGYPWWKTLLKKLFFVEGWYLKVIVFMKLRIAEENQCDSCFTLSKKCSYLKLFLSIFSRIRTEYGEIRSIQYWKYGPE